MEFQRWIVGTPTKYSPADESFLRTATDAGFYDFDVAFNVEYSP